MENTRTGTRRAEQNKDKRRTETLDLDRDFEIKGQGWG